MQMDQFQKDFVKADYFEGSHIDFGNQWTAFATRFASVTNLDLDTAIVNAGQLPVIMNSTFPRLKILELDSFRDGASSITIVMVSILVGGAPELESLTVRAKSKQETPFSMDMLVKSISKNQLLANLKVETNDTIPVNPDSVSTLIDNHPSMIT